MTGMYLRESSGNVSQYQARLMGYGNSLLVQGSYLLLFDMALLFLNEQILTDMMEVRNSTISLSPTAVKWFYRF